MLKNKNNEKPKEILICNEDWYKIKKLCYKKIIEELTIAKKLLEFGYNINIAAGIYTYALEEFGKLLLLNKSQNIPNNLKKKIMYRNEFSCHKKKFETALDFFTEL